MGLLPKGAFTELRVSLRDSPEQMERTIDPKQFLGIEINPRAVAIAEVVLWIG